MAFHLSYSGRRMYIVCPRQYYFNYVKKEIIKKDIKSSLFGSIIGKIIEWFYNKRLWTYPDVYERTIQLSNFAIQDVYEHKKCTDLLTSNFTSYIREELNRRIPDCIDIIKNCRLISPNTLCELDLTVDNHDKSSGIDLEFSGIADFIHQFGKNDIWILDGKAYNERDLYTDNEQVIWYALLFYLKYHKSPSRLGFVYWKFPENPIHWVDFDESSLRDIYRQTFDIVKRIKLQLFDPKPSKACKLCPYLDKCDDGIEFNRCNKLNNFYVTSSSVFEIDFI